MMIKKILITLSFLGLLSACGGPGESADIPEAQPAGSTSAISVGQSSPNGTFWRPAAMASASVLRSQARIRTLPFGMGSMS